MTSIVSRMIFNWRHIKLRNKFKKKKNFKTSQFLVMLVFMPILDWWPWSSNWLFPFRVFFFFLMVLTSQLVCLQGSSHCKVRWLEKTGRGICGNLNIAIILLSSYILFLTRVLQTIPNWFSFIALRLKKMFSYGQSHWVNVIVANIYMNDFQKYDSYKSYLFILYFLIKECLVHLTHPIYDYKWREILSEAQRKWQAYQPTLFWWLLWEKS